MRIPGCLALGLALAALPAMSRSEGLPKIYALVGAVGAQFSVVHEVQRTGSHLAPYRRSAVDATNNVLNRLVLESLDKAIANVEPESQRIYLAIAPGRMEEVAPALRESVAIGQVVAELEKMPQRLNWDRVVVVTPAYEALERDGMASRLQGLGLFLEPLCQSDALSCEYNFRPPSGPKAETPQGETISTNYFVAPYSYIEVWVLDAKTLAVLDKQRSLENRKLFDPRSDSQDLARNIDKRVLAAHIANVVDLSVREAVMHTELRGKVEVTEPREVKPGDAGK